MRTAIAKLKSQNRSVRPCGVSGQYTCAQSRAESASEWIRKADWLVAAPKFILAAFQPDRILTSPPRLRRLLLCHGRIGISLIVRSRWYAGCCWRLRLSRKEKRHLRSLWLV